MPAKIRYVWFDGETIQELKRRLNAVEQPILKVTGQGAAMTLEVLDPTASPDVVAQLPALNEAHPCPPFCR